MNGENQVEADNDEQERKREWDQAQMSEREQSSKGSGNLRDRMADNAADTLIDKTPAGKLVPSKTLAKEGIRTALTGKVLKGKNKFLQFLIISAAIISTFTGAGLVYLIKCFKEEPITTGLMCTFWILVIIFLIILLTVFIIYGTCEIFGVSYLSKLHGFLTGSVDFCKYVD